MRRLNLGHGSIFICYAHADNSSKDPRKRWLDRFLEFLRPLERYEELSTWSDKELVPGEMWDNMIEFRILCADVGVLLVSPAFLASDYIARSEGKCPNLR
jgi:hypothetical protein